MPAPCFVEPPPKSLKAPTLMADTRCVTLPQSWSVRISRSCTSPLSLNCPATVVRTARRPCCLRVRRDRCRRHEVRSRRILAFDLRFLLLGDGEAAPRQKTKERRPLPLHSPLAKPLLLERLDHRTFGNLRKIHRPPPNNGPSHYRLRLRTVPILHRPRRHECQRRMLRVEQLLHLVSSDLHHHGLQAKKRSSRASVLHPLPSPPAHPLRMGRPIMASSPP